MKKAVFISFVFFFLLFLKTYGEAREETDANVLLYFYSPGCHKCARTIENVMPLVEKSFRGSVRVEYKDISDVENYKLLFGLKNQYAADVKSDFPVLYMNGVFIDGRRDENLTLDAISKFIKDALPRSARSNGPPVKVDLLSYFKKLGLFTVIMAGLADGINPCSFTVIVFFMSFLFMQGYDRRSIAAAGITFIVAVFITYVLIGAGIFSSLYLIKGFWAMSGIISASVGILSIGLGAFSAYDAFRFLKSGLTDDMILQLPRKIKKGIQGIIGSQYRKTQGHDAQGNMVKIIAGTLMVGFLVSIFESVCTGQLYLPTIVFVLKNTSYKLQALAYLLLYNMMFVVPLAAVFAFALAGVSSQRFSVYLKKHMFLIKIMLAVLFILLGVSLVYADTVKSRDASSSRKDDPYFFDFGKVKEGDILKHRFYLKNDTKQPIEIKQVNTSCSCTISKVDEKLVRPGRKVPIEIQFNTKGYPGERTRYLYVHTDVASNPIIVFEIKADIAKKE